MRVSLLLVALAPKVAMITKVEWVARSMRKPVSLLELSIQARSIWELPKMVAVRPDGAAGTVGRDVGAGAGAR